MLGFKYLKSDITPVALAKIYKVDEPMFHYLVALKAYVDTIEKELQGNSQFTQQQIEDLTKKHSKAILTMEFDIQLYKKCLNDSGELSMKLRKEKHQLSQQINSFKKLWLYRFCKYFNLI